MKKCFEIYPCTSLEYLTCSAKMSMRNCWLLKNGCQCRKDPDLTCERCFIFKQHQEEIFELVKKAQESDSEAIEQLVEEYSRFVFQIGKRFFLPGASKEDVTQEGMIGLFNAIINFNPELDTSFDDFVSLSIRNGVLRALRTATQLKQKLLNEAFSLDEDPFFYSSVFSDVNVEDQVLGKMSVKGLSRSFKRILSPMEYEIIGMRIADASVDEMAVSSGLTKKQVENALFRARRKISIFLRNELELHRESIRGITNEVLAELDYEFEFDFSGEGEEEYGIDFDYENLDKMVDEMEQDEEDLNFGVE